MERNPYRIIHKVIRKRLFEVTAAAGGTDFRSDVEVAQLRRDYDSLIALLDHHARHEDEVIHPMLKAGTKLEDVTAAHREVDEECSRLSRALDQLADSEPQDRSAIGYELYLRLARFTAHFIEHAHYEETDLLAAMRSSLSDRDFVELSRADYGQAPPDAYASVLQSILPALNPDDVEMLFTDMRDATGLDAARELLTALRDDLPAAAVDRVTRLLD